MASIMINFYRNYNSSDTTINDHYTSADPMPTIEACGWTPPEGYQFKEWNTAQDGSGYSFQPGEALAVGSQQSEVYKYAIWEPILIPYLVTNMELTDVADAIRTKGGTSAALEWPDDYVDAIDAIETSRTPIVTGHIRGDAELAKSWTYNKLIVADEGITIPEYTTADTVLKSKAEIANESLDLSNYSYLLLYRSLTMPIYSDSAISAGRHIYYAHSFCYKFMYIPPSVFDYNGRSALTTLGSANVFSRLGAHNCSRSVYYTVSDIGMSTTSYGAYANLGTTPIPTVSETSPYNVGTLTITAPDLKIRGNVNILNSTNWAKITDIRYQYIFELWRVPQSNSVHGWEVESQFRHILDCANGTGTLT